MIKNNKKNFKIKTKFFIEQFLFHINNNNNNFNKFKICVLKNLSEIN